MKGHILTSTHPIVIAEHVSRRAHALVRAEGVDAAEGAKQRVHGTFVDVWMTKTLEI